MSDFIRAPFRIVRDTNEGAPWQFDELRTTSTNPSKPIVLTRDTFEGQPLVVDTVDRALWPKGRSDYEIDGHPTLIQIEAKHTLDDLFQSFGKRRGNFEAEIERLNRRANYAAVIVCSSWASVLNYNGHSQMNPQAVRASVNSWQIKYPGVHWWFIPDRSECERTAFELMEQAWRKR